MPPPDRTPRPPPLDPDGLARLAELMVDHDLALLRVGPGLRLGFEGALARMHFHWRALAPETLCVLMRQPALDRPALLALCTPHFDSLWLWQRGVGWQVLRPKDGQVLREETRDFLAPLVEW
jgi:hypothetical protein